MPTSRLASSGGGSPSSASDRAVGPILAAQPQVRARPVRVFFLNGFIRYILGHFLHRYRTLTDSGIIDITYFSPCKIKMHDEKKNQVS